MNYKSYIGPEKMYDQIGKIVFELLKKQGLKRTHKVLDIGCGSLRIGQHLINYLNKGNYYGIEPNKWLVDEALKHEDIKSNKNPTFNYEDDFNLSIFDEKFDFILANSIFIHASKEQIEKCFKEVEKVLDGKFIFNFIRGNGNQKKDWSYPSSVTYTKVYIEGLCPLNHKLEYVDVDYPGKQLFIVLEKCRYVDSLGKDYIEVPTEEIEIKEKYKHTQVDCDTCDCNRGNGCSLKGPCKLEYNYDK
jgi:SAM-dependent methyltransferase